MLSHILGFYGDIVVTDISTSHIIVCHQNACVDIYQDTHMVVVLGQHILLPTTPNHIYQYIQTRHIQYINNRSITWYGLVLSPLQNTLSYGDKIVHCTPLERDILRILMTSDTVSKADLLHTVWRVNQQIHTHTVETHMSRLRKKISGIFDGVHICLTAESVYKLIKYQK